MKRSSPGERSSPGTARFRSLLVPIDLTPSTDRIVGRLALLPLAEAARVTILHVVPGSLSAKQRQSAERDAKKALAAEARHLRGSLPKNVTIQLLVKSGSAAKAISACAAKAEAELIVMGRGGGRAMGDVFLGSTAERVVRRAQLPVLVVRMRPRAAYSQPALALDLDQAAREAIRVMLLVIPPTRPRVAVIHAYAIPHVGRYYPSLSGDEFDKAKEESQIKATQKVGKLLGTALAELNVRPEDGPSWKTHVRYGPPRMVVASTVKKTETDLLVLGTHGRTGAAYAFLGTVAGDMLRAASCDVLVVPPAPPRGPRTSVRDREED